MEKLMDSFEFKGIKFEVSAEWLRGLCRKWAIEEAENTVLQYGNKESYIEGRTDALYENIEAETVYDCAVNDGIIEDTLHLNEVVIPKHLLPTGTWVIIATNLYSYDNMEQHIQAMFDEKEAVDKFFETVNDYLKEEKSTLAETYVDKDLTLKEYVSIASENGDELQYGIEEDKKNKLFTIYRKIQNNDCDNPFDVEEVKIRLVYVPLGQQITFVGEPLLDNVEDVEPLFKKA